MKRTLIILTILLASHMLWAKGPEFSFAIPDSLKKGADAVFLFHHTTYTRTSKADLTEKVHYAVTILSDRGDDYAEIMLGYDSFSSYQKISCTLYDAAGKEIRKVKKSEMRDYSAYDGFTLFSNNRLLYFTALNSTYPYTIELEYELQNKGFLGLSTWYPITQYRQGVIEATLTIQYPTDLPIQYKAPREQEFISTVISNGSYSGFQWKMEQIKPKEYERWSPKSSQLFPAILLAPVEFSFDKSEGQFQDWKTLGTWAYQLLDQKYELTDATKQQLSKLKSEYPDSKELARQVYKFMQSRTRYVGIQLGIGGFKPFSPELVDEVGYGDCKALSYYTKALLQFVGIPSEYTIIGIDKREIVYTDFPSINQTNHAILCVPMEQDTVWLECTSQTAPFNYLYDGTSGRKALLVTPEGGKLVTTPTFNENKRINQAQVSLQSTGEVSCNITTKSTGVFYDDKSYQLQLSEKELREKVLKESSVSDITLQSVSASEDEAVPQLTINRTFSTRNMATKAGNRWIVELSPFVYIAPEPKQRSERINAVDIEEKKTWEDEVTLQLPDGFEVEHLPQGKTIETEFGNYRSEITSEKGKVNFKRTLTIEENLYPKEKYPDFIAFINHAAEADKCKVVLKTP